MTKKLGLLWATMGLLAIIAVFMLFSRANVTTWIVVAALAVWVGWFAWHTIHQRVGDGRHPNLHYPDVCESCDPLLMSNGAPITDIVKWVAAQYRCTREQAQELLKARKEALSTEFARYLALFK